MREIEKCVSKYKDLIQSIVLYPPELAFMIPVCNTAGNEKVL